MKYRKSFVTNSSSSSFICDACGTVNSGWDMSPSNCGGFTCENDHSVCSCTDKLDTEIDREFITDVINKRIEYYRTYKYYVGLPTRQKELIDDCLADLEELKNIDETEHDEYECFVDSFIEGYYDYCVPAFQCPICQLEAFCQEELCQYLFKKYEVSRDAVFAELKAINKRRKKLHNHEYITHVCTKFGVSEETLLNEVKEKYKTYDEFVNNI